METNECKDEVKKDKKGKKRKLQLFLKDVAKENRKYARSIGSENWPSSVKLHIEVIQTNPLSQSLIIYKPEIVIKAETTEESLRRIKLENPKAVVTLLSFGNSRRTGGSYKEGAQYQEECLCYSAPLLYNSLREIEYPFDHTHELLMTTNVSFTRNSNRNYETETEEKSPIANVITAAAPDRRESVEDDDTPEQILALLDAIVKLPLLVDDTNVTTHLILGSFGNGSFQNCPFEMATLFTKVLEKYMQYYQQIIFAIPDENSDNYQVYNSIIGTFIQQ